MAKLEMKILLAMLLMRYDYRDTLVDVHGNLITELLVLNRNDTFQVSFFSCLLFDLSFIQSRPLGKLVHLKIKRIKE